MTIFLSMQELHDEHYKVYTNIERRNRGIHRITVSFRANMNWIHMNNPDCPYKFHHLFLQNSQIEEQQNIQTTPMNPTVDNVTRPPPFVNNSELRFPVCICLYSSSIEIKNVFFKLKQSSRVDKHKEYKRMLQSRIMPFIIAKPEPRSTQADMICKSSDHCYIVQTLNFKVYLFQYNHILQLHSHRK